MTCAEARALLLEADPAALAGEGTDPLARHLATCPSCAAVAVRLRAALDELDRELAPTPAAAAFDAAALIRLAEARPAAARRWAPGRILIPLAAAAALAALWLARSPAPLVSPTPPRVAAAVNVLSVSAATPTAVLATSNPNVTVIWFFQGEQR